MALPDLTPLSSLLPSARQVILLLPQHPSYDIAASGLALKLSLEASGKSVLTVCPDPMTVEFNRLIGIDSVLTALSGRSLIISFPGQTESVDKISYNLDQGELQLVITPKQNSPDLDYRRLKFTPGTGQADLVIAVGVNQISDLGNLYADIKDFLSSSKIISLTHGTPKDNFAPAPIFDLEVSCLSELTAHLLKSLGLSITPDIATNLLSGLETATANFQSPTVSAATFDIAGQLLRLGARRHQPLSSANFPPGSIPTSVPSVAPAAPPPPPIPSITQGFGTDSAQPVKDASSPSDWYEPKIYHGPILQ